MYDTDDVERLFETQLAAGLHHGAQLAVYHDGELVVDLAGGEGPDGEPTTTDRRHLLFSCTKPYAGACLHHLADRGALDYDDRVTDHWPGYADGDVKAETTVRHVLCHRAGLPESDFDARPDQWPDAAAAATAMADATLASPPGETVAYHSLTYGWLVGELVRQISGTPIEAYAREHVFDPLGMARTDLADAEGSAPLAGFEPFDRCRDPETGLGTPPATAAALFNDPDVRGAVVPAATGIGTAREMARFYACLANGGELDGTRVLSRATVEALTSEQAATDHDATLGVPRRYGLGVELATGPDTKYGAGYTDGTFGHGGLGSSMGWADPDAGLAVAYVTNGVRDGFEHEQRCAIVSDTVRRLAD